MAVAGQHRPLKLRRRLEALVGPAIQLAGLAALVLVVYVVVVIGIGRVPTSDERTLLVFSMVAAAVAALLYQPLRGRLSGLAARLAGAERDSPGEVLRTFGGRLTSALPLDELLLQLAESLRRTLVLEAAEVWTGSGGLLERSASDPDADQASLILTSAEEAVLARAGVPGTAWLSMWLPRVVAGREGAALRAAPITHSGELLGLIVVERPADGDIFGEEDDRVLTELARQVGLALHNVQLDSALQATLDEVRRTNEELVASRARIVATGDAERRRIERNLHDGAQQHLVALAVNLRLTKDLLAEDPDTAVEMLDQLATDVKETIAELRSLAHGIYPPLLVDSGLGEALRAAAGRSPLDVGVDVDLSARYGSEVEAAIYFCCLEALQNAAKHAPEASVTVRVWEEGGGLCFEVADDGPGFEAAVATRGHGFTNMTDRVGAIGGSVHWDSAPGAGTRVRGSIPVQPDAADES